MLAMNEDNAHELVREDILPLLVRPASCRSEEMEMCCLCSLSVMVACVDSIPRQQVRP